MSEDDTAKADPSYVTLGKIKSNICLHLDGDTVVEFEAGGVIRVGEKYQDNPEGLAYSFWTVILDYVDPLCNNALESFMDSRGWVRK
jgi:hypothetical protein